MMPAAATGQGEWPSGSTKTGRQTQALHSFFALDDGSCLAFFEPDDFPFEFKRQHDFDRRIAARRSAEPAA